MNHFLPSKAEAIKLLNKSIITTQSYTSDNHIKKDVITLDGLTKTEINFREETLKSQAKKALANEIIEIPKNTLKRI